jgi:hypothetical protein
MVVKRGGSGGFVGAVGCNCEDRLGCDGLGGWEVGAGGLRCLLRASRCFC